MRRPGRDRRNLGASRARDPIDVIMGSKLQLLFRAEDANASQWVDRKRGVVLTASGTPTLNTADANFNLHPSVQLTSAAQRYETLTPSSWLAPSQQSYWIAVCCRINTTPASTVSLVQTQYSGSPTDAFNLQYVSGGTARVLASDGASQKQLTKTATMATSVLMTANLLGPVEGQQLTLAEGGSIATSTSLGAFVVDSLDRLCIGSFAGTSALASVVFVAVGSGEMLSNERGNLRSYCQSYYGIP